MAFWREVLTFDPLTLRPRRGWVVLATIALALGLSLPFGQTGFIVVMGALFTVLCDRPGSVAERLAVLALVALAGIALTVIGGITTTPLALAIVGVFVVTLVCSVAVRHGARLARAASLLNIWYLVALPLVHPATIAVSAAGFALGSGLAVAAVWWGMLRHPHRASIYAAVAAAVQGRDPLTPAVPVLPWQPWMGVYVLVRAGATALAMWVGGTFFPLYPLWAAMAVVVVVQPVRDKSVAKGIQRVVGTLLGVLLGAAIVWLVPDSPLFLLVFAVVSFLYGATTGLNYTINVGWMTTTLVLVLHLTGKNPFAAGVARLLETAIGVGIAAVTYAVLLGLVRWAQQRGTAPPTDDATLAPPGT